MNKYHALFTLIFLLMFGNSCAWAQNEITVVRGEEDYPPMEMMVGGKLTGLHVDIVNTISARIGIKVNWQSLPWKRALQLVESGEADGITYIAKTPEREVWAIFLDDNWISNTMIKFIVVKENAGVIHFNGNVNEFLKRRKLLVLRGFTFGDDKIDKVDRQDCDTMEQMVTMLKKKRHDVAIVNWADFTGTYTGRPEMQEILPLNPPAMKSKNYIAFSRARKADDIAGRFSKELKAFRKTPAYKALLKRYKISD